MEQEDRAKTQLERFILPLLRNIGLIGSVLLIVAYIVTILILIFGFQVDYRSDNVLIFAGVNAIIGVLIMAMLKLQGTQYAKHNPDNKEIINKYYNTKTKDKKLRSIKYYWVVSTIKDIVFKGISLAASTGWLVYIAIEGSHDYMMLLLAVVNLLMFVSFGLLALNGSYEYYNNMHIPYIKEQIRIREEELKNGVETIHKSRDKLSKQDKSIQRDVDIVRDFLSKELQRERPPKQ